MADLVILIPASGSSRRMRGTDKLIEEVSGEPILRRTARIAVDTCARVLVTLPGTGPLVPARRAVLAGLGLRILALPDAHEGMAASLRAGARAIGPAAGLMVLLPDMPDITIEDVQRLAAAFDDDPATPVRATSADGTLDGHPVILPRRLMPEVAVLTGDCGARVVLEGETLRRVPLPAHHAVTDLDTPEDWSAWRAGRGSG
ncbi:MAG: NTP transferase domain-containing protein [Albidovulum sp.]